MITAEQMRKRSQQYAVTDDWNAKTVDHFWARVQCEVPRYADAGLYCFKCAAPENGVLQRAEEVWQAGVSQMRERGFHVAVDTAGQVVISWGVWGER